MVLSFVFFIAAFGRLWFMDNYGMVRYRPGDISVLRHVSCYLKQRFFLSEEPPLRTMLLTGASLLGPWDGENIATEIENEYSPPVSLRILPVICTSLLAPLSLLIVKELRPRSQYLSAVAPVVIIADRDFLLHSCNLQTESLLLVLMGSSVFGALKLVHNNRTHHGWQCFWLLMTGVNLGLTISSAYIGYMTAVLVIFLVFWKFWEKDLPNQEVSNVALCSDFLQLLSGVCLLPVCIYVTVFYIHLSILTYSGPHDHHMTSAFQASLKGGLSTLTEGQPHEVVFGSQITLRRTYGGKPCWLHSHTGLYPHSYPDGRISSHQQQVSCVSKKDVNNWWIVKHPHRNHLYADSPPVIVRHGDLIQLVHGMTRRALHSHDVAAPLSTSCQEVSCYIDYGTSALTQNLWKVEVINRQVVGDIWRPLRSEVRLVHVNTSHVLKTSGSVLPDWGGNQYEVVSDRTHHQAAAVWNVEEHVYTKERKSNETDVTSESPDIAKNNPLQPTRDSNSPPVNSLIHDTSTDKIPGSKTTDFSSNIDSIKGDVPTHKKGVLQSTTLSTREDASCQTPVSVAKQDSITQTLCDVETTHKDPVSGGQSANNPGPDHNQDFVTGEPSSNNPGPETYTVHEDSRWSSRVEKITHKPEAPIRLDSSHSNGSLPPLGFWSKFVEVQRKMWYFVEKREFGDLKDEQWSSGGPLTWIFCWGNLPGQPSQKTGVQINLWCRNSLVRISGSLAVVVYLVLLATYLMLQKRQCISFNKEQSRDFLTIGRVCVGGYFVHFLPYFLSERPLISSQFLPALFFSILLLPLVLDHIASYMRSPFFHVSVALWLSLVVSENTRIL